MSEEESATRFDILSNRETELAMMILMYGVTPAISIIGIVGNVCSILVLLKQNCKKCSNILLLGLTISDLTYLIGFNSVPKIIYTLSGKQSFPYEASVSETLFFFYRIFLIIDYSSGFVGLTLPMLITIERLVTVFFPLKVSKIITPRRTIIAISGVFIFWYGNFIYTMFWFSLSYTYELSGNRSVYMIAHTEVFEHDKPAVYAINEAWIYLSMRIPSVFTFVGCIIIGIKIKMASDKRREMTGKNQSMYRTTKTLLAVCVVYTMTCAIASLPAIVPQYVSFSISDETTSNICQVTYHIISTAGCINSSCNFVIYIVFNKNFRDAYKALFSKSRRRIKATDTF
ncbi:unnamed protein product [Candidula unifasciata]|uniref:G-protein coupled receptors family 1 profile domain-containing protein n=1 Tax=Candidula unifasciata TaxID=100452 RepID=A0A8S3ZC97_9EUPU|nr:unnamed protein product [Candidula unifasciata]